MASTASTRRQRGGNAILYTVLAIGTLVFVNIISSRFFTRVDLTAEKVFTISAASRKLVAGLPDRMTVKAFISGDLPAQVQSISRYLRDMLDEYATYSKGKLVWEAIDPGSDQKLQEEARRLKVSPAQLSVYDKSKASVSQSFLGVSFQYGGKEAESIPFVTKVDDLEFQISSRIKRLVMPKKPKVGFASGHGEPSLHQGLARAQEELKDYDVTTVDLAEGKKPVPADIDVLVIVGPTKTFADRARYEIDQFLMKGKAVALFVDGMVLETPRGQFGGQAPPRIARANSHGLIDQFAYYGAKLREDLILDRQNAQVILPVGNQRVITNYPAFPVVTNLDRKHAITRDLKGYIPIFPSSVELTKEVREGKSGVTGTVLAQSSAASWRQTGFFVFDPLRQPQPTKELGPFPLAVYLQGSFKSFYSGKAVPPPGAAAAPTEKPAAPSGAQRAPAGARLLVVADGEMVRDEFAGLSPTNLLLLLNGIDYLAQDESLISIRAKHQTRRPLRDVEDKTVTLAKYGNIVGLPLAFILVGVVRWRLRRNSRARAAAEVLGTPSTSGENKA